LKLNSRARMIPLGVKLGAVVALLAIVSISVGVLSTARMSTLSAQQTEMKVQAAEPLLALVALSRDFGALRARFGNILWQGGDDLDTTIGEAEDLMAQVDADVEAYRPLARDQEGVDAMVAALHEYFDTVRQAGDFANSGQSQRAHEMANQATEIATTANDLMQKEAGELADLSDQIDAAGTNAYVAGVIIMWVALVAALVAALVLALVVVRGVTRAVQSVGRSIEALGQGDLTVDPKVASRDELGQMAAALTDALGNLRGAISSVVRTAREVDQSAVGLSASSTQVGAGAEETSTQAGVVAAAADQVSRNVQTVAAGAEEMGASISEIAKNANNAAEVAARATKEAAEANDQISRLGASSQEIGAVVKTITTIAEQTNLLALNATIEAARAGEAGKGFAVVAGEVKELAQETARATEDIARRVEAIQADSFGAVEAVSRIGEIIAQINDFQLTIASAVEEQTVTTQEMSRSVVEAAAGSGEIAANITGVATAADDSSRVVTDMGRSVSDLARLATELREQVATFTYETSA